MAPYVKFIIPFIFATFGLAIWMTWPSWFGLVAFIGVFWLGSIIGTVLFKRLATPRQIREDLEARLHND
jgi:hypothetical protein